MPASPSTGGQGGQSFGEGGLVCLGGEADYLGTQPFRAQRQCFVGDFQVGEGAVDGGCDPDGVGVVVRRSSDRFYSGR